MQSIPQNITDDIVEHLHGDKRTLMTCSLVSRQFEPGCRKHLFSYIELNIPYTICRFHTLLLENPNLAVLVRHLRIYVGGPRFGSDIHLSWILGMLTRLQWLELGHDSLPATNWKCLSGEAQSALLEICQSPSLSILDICHAVGLPPALLRNTRVRKLGVQYVSIPDYCTPVMEIDFTGLEALHICITDSLAMVKNRSLDLYTATINSRQLSIRTYPHNHQLVLEIVHNVMEKASKTLKHVSWQNYRKRHRDLCAITYCWYLLHKLNKYTLAPDFTLATLSNLQSLFFSIDHMVEEDITSAIELLRDPAVSRNLKELTFVFHYMTYVLEEWQIPVEAIPRLVSWNTLDKALGTSHVGVDAPLHTVKVYVESLCLDADARGRQLQRKLEARLPLLVAKGVRVSASLFYNGSV